MILYRIFTEDKNRDGIEGTVTKVFDGFTILTGRGYWRGISEPCLVIEVIGVANDLDAVLRIADRIKEQNEQDSVAITESPVRLRTVGESI